MSQEQNRPCSSGFRLEDQRVMNKEGAAAAEFALKAYSIEFDPAEFGVQPSAIQQIAEGADLTEAPEDAVCSLVIDLMHYCEREEIDWSDDVVSRARERFLRERRGSNAA